jgi:hypothetical protein
VTTAANTKAVAFPGQPNSIQTRLAEFAVPVVGRQAQALAEELLLVVTGVRLFGCLRELQAGLPAF